jgi:hypothetical protein
MVYNTELVGKLRRSISPEGLRVPEDALQLNGRDIPLNCLVTFNRRKTWRYHIERTCSQGLVHVLKDLFSIQKPMFKYKY